MVKTYKLTTIDQAVKVATTLSRSWFRGHSKVYGELVPGAFRKEYASLRPDIEFFMMREFKRKAFGLTSNLPSKNDTLEWLFLMQHHGTPTRLLDWSENALIALYFAVNRNVSNDGELWAMCPGALYGACHYFIRNTYYKDILLSYILEELQYSNDEERENARQRFLENNFTIKITPLAIPPPVIFPRMASQQSAFTIHPYPADNTMTIPQVLEYEEKHLVRYIIPKDSKKGLLKDLAALGITRRLLFPELDSLSSSLKHEAQIVNYSPSEPPKCDGEYVVPVDDQT